MTSLRPPTVADGAALWRLASAAGKLDVNSSYAYLLWARDFAATSVVAVDDAAGVVGFVTGYRRPDDPEVLLVWQVAVDDGHRGQGIAGRMLDHLVGVLADLGGRYVETTVTPDNEPSRAMFEALARRHRTALEVTDLFAAEDFPDPHEPEQLFRIGPIGASGPS